MKTSIFIFTFNLPFLSFVMDNDRQFHLRCDCDCDCITMGSIPVFSSLCFSLILVHLIDVCLSISAPKDEKSEVVLNFLMILYKLLIFFDYFFFFWMKFVHIIEKQVDVQYWITKCITFSLIEICKNLHFLQFFPTFFSYYRQSHFGWFLHFAKIHLISHSPHESDAILCILQ